jgi:hypothetical protein
MTSRSDILPNDKGRRNLSYTARCGWVDWGHAQSSGPAALISQIRSEVGITPGLSQLDITLNGRPAFVIDYGQSMGKTIAGQKIELNTTGHWVVQRGLIDAQLERVALGIFLAASHEFESLQSGQPFSLFSDSGYSGEDLVSNLIGFYSALRGKSQTDMRTMCVEVSVDESLRIWDAHLPKGLGGLKNKTTKPVLFPTEEGNGDTSFPAFLQTVQPQPSGILWVKPKSRFIDGYLVNERVPLDFDSEGKMRIQQKVYQR